MRMKNHTQEKRSEEQRPQRQGGVAADKSDLRPSGSGASEAVCKLEGGPTQARGARHLAKPGWRPKQAGVGFPEGRN